MELICLFGVKGQDLSLPDDNNDKVHRSVPFKDLLSNEVKGEWLSWGRRDEHMSSYK